MTKKMIFKSVSHFADSDDRFVLEAIGMDQSFDQPFFPSEDNIGKRLADIRDAYEIAVGMSIFVVPVTRLMPVQKHENQYFEPYSLPNGNTADDIMDIRRQIELPDDVRFMDCEFFVLYPDALEDREEEYSWLVLLPYTG